MCKTYIPFTSLPLFIVISTLPSHPVQHSRTSEAKLALQKITEGLIEKVNELAALPLNTAAVVTPKKGRKSGTKEGTRELMGLFDGQKIFDYPKPTALLTRLLQYGCDPDEENIVLDFFAGSGSFAHACALSTIPHIFCISVQMNAPIDGKRKSGQNAHRLGIRTIGELCLERIKRACGDAGVRVYAVSEST